MMIAMMMKVCFSRESVMEMEIEMDYGSMDDAMNANVECEDV